MPKIMEVDKVKEKLKDQVMLSNSSSINYLKIINKKNERLFDFLSLAKEKFMNGDNSNIIMI